MTGLHKIYAALDAGEIDVAEAARLCRELRRKNFSWLDRFLEMLAA